MRRGFVANVAPREDHALFSIRAMLAGRFEAAGFDEVLWVSLQLFASQLFTSQLFTCQHGASISPLPCLHIISSLSGRDMGSF